MFGDYKDKQFEYDKTTHFKESSNYRYISLFACYMINRFHHYHILTEKRFEPILETSDSNDFISIRHISWVPDSAEGFQNPLRRLQSK